MEGVINLCIQTVPGTVERCIGRLSEDAVSAKEAVLHSVR